MAVTGNLGLRKPASSDKLLASLDDFNANADLLDQVIGKLSELDTEEKSSLVAAINEALTLAGTAAGFGTPTATVDTNTGTPEVSVTASGPNTAKVFKFIFKNLKGAPGAKGKDGDSYTVKGLYATLSALQAAHPTGSAGDAWFVGTADSNVVYQWDVDKGAWVSVGALKGPKGDPGEQGPQGSTGPQGPSGADGKSAYASAQDGGYTGTEAAFNAALADVENKADKAVSVSVTLPASSWNADRKSQTVTVTGMTTSANCIITAAPASYMAYAEAGVRCTAQISGGLSFVCEEVPTEDLTVNVLILG